MKPVPTPGDLIRFPDVRVPIGSIWTGDADDNHAELLGVELPPQGAMIVLKIGRDEENAMVLLPGGAIGWVAIRDWEKIS